MTLSEGCAIAQAWHIQCALEGRARRSATKWRMPTERRDDRPGNARQGSDVHFRL